MTSSSSNTVGGGGGGDGASTNGHVGNVEKHPRTDVTGDEEKGEVRNSDKRQRVSRELDVGSDRVTRMEPVKYSDCVLTIGGSDMRAARHTYCCHRAVLARSSAHLATLFESGETNVHLGDGLVVPIEPVTFSIFVRLLYDADLHDTLITAENVRVLCELAHYMDAATITRWCEFQLMRTHEKRRGPALISVISTNSDRSGHKYHIGSYVVALWKCNNSYSCFVLGHNTDLTYQLLYSDGDVDARVPESSITGAIVVPPHPLVAPKLLSQDISLSAELLVFAAKNKLPKLLQSCRAAVAADFMRSGGVNGGDVGDNCIFIDSTTGKSTDARLCLSTDELRQLLLCVIRQARDALFHNSERKACLKP